MMFLIDAIAQVNQNIYWRRSVYFWAALRATENFRGVGLTEERVRSTRCQLMIGRADPNETIIVK